MVSYFPVPPLGARYGPRPLIVAFPQNLLMGHLMSKGTLALCSLKSFKCACPATQKGQEYGSLSEALTPFSLCEQTAKALAKLRRCAGSSDPSLFAYVNKYAFLMLKLFS